MPETKVQAQLTEKQGGPRDLEVKYDFGDDLAAMTEAFGEDVVYNNAMAQMKINLQAAMRRAAQPDKEGNTKSDAEIQAMADEWKPGAKTVQRKSTVEKAQEALGKLDENERAQLMELLKKQAAENQSAAQKSEAAEKAAPAPADANAKPAGAPPVNKAPAK